MARECSKAVRASSMPSRRPQTPTSTCESNSGPALSCEGPAVTSTSGVVGVSAAARLFPRRVAIGIDSTHRRRAPSPSRHAAPSPAELRSTPCSSCDAARTRCSASGYRPTNTRGLDPCSNCRGSSPKTDFGQRSFLNATGTHLSRRPRDEFGSPAPTAPPAPRRHRARPRPLRGARFARRRSRAFARLCPPFPRRRTPTLRRRRGGVVHRHRVLLRVRLIGRALARLAPRLRRGPRFPRWRLRRPHGLLPGPRLCLYTRLLSFASRRRLPFARRRLLLFVRRRRFSFAHRCQFLRHQHARRGVNVLLQLAPDFGLITRRSSGVLSPPVSSPAAQLTRHVPGPSQPPPTILRPLAAPPMPPSTVPAAAAPFFASWPPWPQIPVESFQIEWKT